MGNKTLPIGERIAELRQARKITQNELAQYLHISYQSVSNWETATAYPDIGLLPQIAQYFGVSTDYLLGLDERSAVQKRYFLAADQGGSKTRVLLCDLRGKIIDDVCTGGACWFYAGIEKSMEYLGEAVDSLKARAKVDTQEIAFIVCGAAGINWDDERGMFTQALERRINVKAYVYNDCAAAVYCDANEYDNRIVLCAGTEFGASVVTKEMPEPYVYCNQTLPEDMGASAIGTAAVVAVLRAEEKLGPPTALKEHLIKYFDVEDMAALHTGHRRGTLKREYKGLTPLVFELAAAGDIVCHEILLQMASNMTRYAVAAILKFGLSDTPVAVLLAGGVFNNNYEPFYQRISQMVQKTCGKAAVIRTAKEPVYGAYHLGMRKVEEMCSAELK